MRGIDTNVLVRYLVQDDAEQGRKAARFIGQTCSAENPGLINRIVMCELVWVLESAYGYARSPIALAIEQILRTAQFRIEDHSEVWSSLREYRNGADFSDALIATVNRRLGCIETVTFDRKAGRRQGFKAL